jgi:uncharacterized protein YbcV (DUF1398 family)
MSKAIENLMEAQKFAMSTRPKVGGFPYLAEALKLAGVTRNPWNLPSCEWSARVRSRFIAGFRP